MTTAAIICEYNPFHKGHQFHIEETRRKTDADAIIAIMSGNFVQRGEVAIYPKESRAKAALLGGADLVLELPTAYSTGSAEFFAKGAIEILNALGIVDFLSFGAETSDTKALLKIASLLADEPAEFISSLKGFSKEGLSFPAARAKAVCEMLGKAYEAILSTPNNILGIEYCKALIQTNSCIKPFSIERAGANHDSDTPEEGIASATYIRSLLTSLKQTEAHIYMPDFTDNIFKDDSIHSIKALEKAILCELIKISHESLRYISDVSEGLENRIKDAVVCSNTLDELIDSVKTKRYTHSRIRRIVLSAFLGITEADRRSSPAYIKIMAHNEVGKKLIAAAKKTATLPILRNTAQANKLKDSRIKALWERERTFDTIYKMSTL